MGPWKTDCVRFSVVEENQIQSLTPMFGGDCPCRCSAGVTELLRLLDVAVKTFILVVTADGEGGNRSDMPR